MFFAVEAALAIVNGAVGATQGWMFEAGDIAIGGMIGLVVANARSRYGSHFVVLAVVALIAVVIYFIHLYLSVARLFLFHAPFAT